MSDIEYEYAILICGSRDFHALEKVDDRMIQLYSRYGNLLHIIHGNSGNVDRRAAKFCSQLRMPIKCTAFPPKYHEYPGHIAPLKRNDEMLAYPQLAQVISFWNGESAGTHYVIKKSIQQKMDIEIIFDSTVIGGE